MSWDLLLGKHAVDKAHLPIPFVNEPAFLPEDKKTLTTLPQTSHSPSGRPRGHLIAFLGYLSYLLLPLLKNAGKPPNLENTAQVRTEPKAKEVTY